jgi:hypothetical protein
MTFSVTIASIMDLVATLSIKDTQHNDTKHEGLNCGIKHK